MWKEVTRVGIAMSMWVASVMLMVVATMVEEWAIAGWSILVAMGGNLLLAWHLLTVERARVETIAGLAAQVALTRTTLEVVE